MSKRGLRTNAYISKGFTLLELLVVIGIIAILAGLLMPALSGARNKLKQATCSDNLSQIVKGVHMYADDFNQVLFPLSNRLERAASLPAIREWTAFNALMRGYVGLKGPPAPSDRIFACPADTFCNWNTEGSDRFLSQPQHFQATASFSSYAFNAGNAVFGSPRQFEGMFPGIMGSRLSAIASPAKTVLVSEFIGLDGNSWHNPAGRSETHYNDAPSMLGFADGHVSYTKMYCGSNNPSHHFQFPFAFNPPAGYEYRWTAD
jgi:prepilin-type N-terminal cleavage/methylation domain-containing protein